MSTQLHLQQPTRKASASRLPPGREAQAAKQTFRYHFMTPVWNAKYIDLFVHYSLPSQLAPGNLPALIPDDCLYHIFTRAAEVKLITQTPAFRKLAQSVPVAIHGIDDLDFKNPHLAMSECFRRGMAEASEQDFAYVFLTPDSVWSDGSFRSMDQARRAGKRAVMVAGIRTCDDGILPEMRGFLAEPGVLHLPPRDLVRISMSNLHPVSIGHIVQDRLNRAPQHFYFDVAGQGLVARCFHMHPLMVRPAIRPDGIPTTVDGDFVNITCPDFDSVHVVEDSDEIFVAEVSSPVHQCNLVSPLRMPWPEVRQWMAQAVNDYHRRYFKRAILMHAADVDWTWHQAISESEELVADLIREEAGPAPARASIVHVPAPKEETPHIPWWRYLRYYLFLPIRKLMAAALRPYLWKLEEQMRQRVNDLQTLDQRVSKLLAQVLLLERQTQLARSATAAAPSEKIQED